MAVSYNAQVNNAKKVRLIEGVDFQLDLSAAPYLRPSDHGEVVRWLAAFVNRQRVNMLEKDRDPFRPHSIHIDYLECLIRTLGYEPAEQSPAERAESYAREMVAEATSDIGVAA